MAVPLTGVALPRFYSVLALEPATAQEQTSIRDLQLPFCALAPHPTPPTIPIQAWAPAPVPLFFLLLRGSHLGAAGRIDF